MRRKHMRSTLRRRLIAPAAAIGVLSLVLAGCAADTDTDAGAGGDTDCTAYEAYGTFEGETVELYATIIDT
jgi:alpha-glucoside transport system substrate-binding protein